MNHSHFHEGSQYSLPSDHRPGFWGYHSHLCVNSEPLQTRAGPEIIIVSFFKNQNLYSVFIFGKRMLKIAQISDATKPESDPVYRFILARWSQVSSSLNNFFLVEEKKAWLGQIPQ